MLSADVVWCDRCGAYATVVSKGLTAECPGMPSHWKGGGRPQQLAALRAGRHPKTGAYIGAPCPEPRWDALATCAGDASALPRVARGFLEQRRPAHDRQARTGQGSPGGGGPVSLAGALVTALVVREGDRAHEEGAGGSAPVASTPPAQLATPASPALPDPVLGTSGGGGRQAAATPPALERRAAIYARVRARLASAAATAADGEPATAAGNEVPGAVDAPVSVALPASGVAGPPSQGEGARQPPPGIVRRRCRTKALPDAWR